MKLLPLVLLALAAPALAKDKKPPAPQAAPIVASVDGLPIGAIPKQDLPAKGCAAFLWTRGPSQALIAMATADPAAIRLTVDGKIQDFAMRAENGVGGFGFSQTNEYRGGDLTATLDLTISTAADIAGGARITDSTLRIDRPGRDSVVIPVGGLIGCA
ncbi:hypothetical protein [Sphingomonas sp.]|jgi:hypothetical protein|uniref:hypothetical protein n=1 Tax=Sphingomonas sp. TaxID=28214 RepID=UPI002E362B4A|nr:hypothetical protein [Sphingomonas sp.]HEX4694152.1 hypothetical protein [Sphingomonas sp.]